MFTCPSIAEKVIRVKIRSSLALAAAVSVLLVGCTSTSNTADVEKGCVTFPTGKQLDSAKIGDNFGKEPKIDIAKGTKVEASQSRVIVEGKGEKVRPNDTAVADISLYNATTGEFAFKAPYNGQGSNSVQINEQLIESISAAVGCHTVGSRVAVLAAPKDLFGAQGNEQLKIGKDDSVLVVADIISNEKAPKARELKGDYKDAPKVEFPGNGEAPKVTLPDTNPPKELTIEVLEKGDGPVIAETDSPKLQTLGLNWNTGATFQKFDSVLDIAANGYVPGFSKAIVGQTKGSKILAILPPADGYGAGGNAQAGIGGKDTIVFVIDIAKD
ncbi:hypothetical protein D9V34_08525 [Mycetocola lacteus]|uniref:peptidylprolyl isomerase n=1 Tax=Mycetocola lacteus TaxID=76637 RepID=A0A3L7AUP7_9MICO|nr:hypothetical protein D9V34_08525 [Mycetocola lacteus]